jgi:hypothetical protein
VLGGLAFCFELPFFFFKCGNLGLQLGEACLNFCEFRAEPGNIGFKGCNDISVETLGAITLQRPAALIDDAEETVSAFDEALDVAEAIAHIARSPGGQLRLDTHDRGVEFRKSGFRCVLNFTCLYAVVFDRDELRSLRGNLTASNEHAECVEFGLQFNVSLCRMRLALEGFELSTHLAQQVLESDKVGFGGIESPLSFLAALSILEHPGCLFNNRPTIFRSRV